MSSLLAAPDVYAVFIEAARVGTALVEVPRKCSVLWNRILFVCFSLRCDLRFLIVFLPARRDTVADGTRTVKLYSYLWF